jgi:hypothetical protein
MREEESYLGFRAGQGIDLHIHSVYSDGSLSPQNIIEIALVCQLVAISITDHDQLTWDKHYPVELDVKGIEMIPGIELSCDYKNREIHLLGYYFDPDNSEIMEYSKQMHLQREIRAEKILDRLQEFGIDLSIDEVVEKAGPGIIARPHIAQLMLKKGYVHSFQEAFDKYLGEFGIANIQKQHLDFIQGIELIHQAGGLAFLAHPIFYRNLRLYDDLIDAGIDGIETIHPKHSQSDVQLYRDIAENYSLLECGGSDFHGFYTADAAIGHPFVHADILTKIKEKRISRN